MRNEYLIINLFSSEERARLGGVVSERTCSCERFCMYTHMWVAQGAADDATAALLVCKILIKMRGINSVKFRHR
jgi:hypothetical protein